MMERTDVSWDRISGDAELVAILRSDAIHRLGDASADDCALIAEAKMRYERLFPKTRHGGDRRSGNQKLNLSFCKFARNLIGLSVPTLVPTLERAVKIGVSIPDDMRARLPDPAPRHVRTAAASPPSQPLPPMAAARPLPRYQGDR